MGEQDLCEGRNSSDLGAIPPIYGGFINRMGDLFPSAAHRTGTYGSGGSALPTLAVHQARSPWWRVRKAATRARLAQAPEQ